MPEKENNNQWEKTITSTWNREINTISSHLKARLLHIWPSRSSWFVSAYSVFRVAFTSLRSRRLEVVGTRKNRRPRSRNARGHACLPRARPFSLSLTTSKRLLRRLGFHLQIFSLSLIKAVFTLYWISFCAPRKAVRYGTNSNGPG